ncbi:MAG TPA: GGDEF domain-containing protein [Rhodocyclaceae bacterium]
MRYAETIEQSAEYLRLALPMMARQAAGMHPVSYAVWYEYVSGRNAALKAALDAALREGAVFDDKAIHDVFHQHIADREQDLAQRVTDGVQKVMAEMSQSASQANHHAEAVGSVLERLSEDIAGGVQGGALDAGMQTLRLQTREMQGAVSTLKSRLEDSGREIERLREEVAKAREAALADALTGLVNRRGFDMALGASLASRDPEEAGPSLLILDIDHFKRVNDSYGHLFGDKVIRAVAQILKDNVKEMDVAARYGGEEFCILLPKTPLDGARHVAEKIRSLVERSRVRRIDNNETVANVTISLGAACYRDGESALEFVARADRALYQSKLGGRNRTTLSTA